MATKETYSLRSPSSKQVGNILKTLREQTGLLQEEVSKQMGFKTATSYGLVEQGRKATLDHIIASANLFGYEVEVTFRPKARKK